MNTTRKRNLIIFLFLIFICVGLYLLADSPVGDSFMEGFEAGYRGEQPPK